MLKIDKKMMSQNKGELINRVANSGLITIKLEEFLPKEKIVEFDLKDYLFHGLILKEKDFRMALKELDWSALSGDVLAVYCSTDAIIPQWAYMLVAVAAQPHYKSIHNDTAENVFSLLIKRRMDTDLDYKTFEGQRVVVKGCSDLPVPASAYIDIACGLQPYAQSIMYGEPCSTVPIFKRPRKV